MKKITLLVIACLILAGCSVPKSPSPASPIPAATETIPAQLVTYTLYLPNENADGFQTEKISIAEISPEIILTQLQENGVIPEDVIINTFEIKNTDIYMDFNQPLANAINSTGSSGELMIVGSIVNTYLSAYNAETLYFTINGEILESGHVIYDFPISFTE